MRRQYNFTSKVSHLALSAFLASTTLLTACGDFLEIEPRDKVILEQFWNDKGDVDNCVAGCYEGLQSITAVTRMAAWGEFRSENVKEGLKAEDDDLHMYKLLNENIDASNVYTDWSSLYTVINRCNTVIKYAPGVSEKDPSFTDSELNATIAEVSALRDLCYFYLIRAFRDVPYNSEAYTDDNQRMDLPATPFYDVLDSLITDLEKVKSLAVRRYPTDGYQSLYQTGRITQDAIHAMLCEMYLWKQDYRKCIEYADLVIESKRKEANDLQGTIRSDMNNYFNGYPLIRDWTNQSGIFGNAYDAIFGTGNSTESIFELTYMRNDNMLANAFVNTYYGYDDRGWYNRVKPSDYVGLDASNNVFKLFSNNYDSRCHSSFNPMTQTSTLSYIGKYVFSASEWEVSTTDNKITPYLVGIYSKDKNHSNWIFYRLTDIMLLKAEALVQLSAGDGTPELAEAFMLANTVNKRSVMKEMDKLVAKDTLDAAAYTAKSDVEELVMEERHREFLFEGKRWFDLVRRSMRDGNTDYLRSQMGNKGLRNASAVSKMTRMEAIFWPYYLEELKVNKNLTQNPAFGSGENSSYETTK